MSLSEGPISIAILAHEIEVKLLAAFPNEEFLPEESESAATAFASRVRWAALEEAERMPTRPVSAVRLNLNAEGQTDLRNHIMDASGLDWPMANVALDAILAAVAASKELKITGLGTIVFELGHLEVTLDETLPPAYLAGEPQT